MFSLIFNFSKHYSAKMLAAGLFFMLFASISHAEDIDIYSTPSNTAGAPNLLIILDNAAAWNGDLPGASCTYYDGTSPSLSSSKAAGHEQCALVNVANSIATNPDGSAKINLGIMVFGRQSNQGGLLKQPLTPMTAGNKAGFINTIKSFQTPEDEGNGSQIGATMQESYAYYTGGTGISGTSYSGVSPAQGCQRNFIVYIANAATQGKPQDNGPVQSKLNAAIDATVSNVALKNQLKTAISTGNKYDSNWADEWSRFLYQNDIDGGDTGLQNITTYTIAVFDPGKVNTDYVGFAANMARYGGGKSYTANNANDIIAALTKILNELQAINSQFASATIPISVNAQGTYLNQVFVGVFRPDANGSPRWMGNLKQYQFALDASKNLFLADATGASAISSSGTGFITPNAISFWTTNTPTGSPNWPSPPNGFWANPQGTGGTLDSPDGEVVEKGGAGEVLRYSNLSATYNGNDINSRNLLTCNGVGTCANFTTFSPANAWLTGATGSQALGVPSNLSASLTAGSTITGATFSMAVSGTGHDKTYTATVSYPKSTGITVATGDTFVTTLSDPFACGSASPCSAASSSVTSGSNYQFTFNASSGNNGDQGTGNLTIASSVVSATLSGSNPFNAGDSIQISGCSGSGDYNLRSQLGNSFTTTIGSVNGNTLTFVIPSPAATSNAITCSISSTFSATALINWVRGYNNLGDEVDPVGTVRPSIHGDVLHSRPIVVNYGGSTGTVVFYGSNDGVFRAVNANQTGNISLNGRSIPAGGEIWGFIAPEFLGKLKRLALNTPGLKVYSTPAGITPTPQPKDYFFDGQTGLYQNLSTGQVVLYPITRRGGDLIYAIDVTNPGNPSFLWKKTSSDLSELGQTWSQPKVAKVKGYSNPVLIFGAGYDSSEDLEPPGNASKGRGIYILDALSGSLVRAFTHASVNGMDYPIAADITLADRDADGYVERLYAADTGGNIWRIDLEPLASNGPANWQIYQFAALGGSTSGNNAPRKFLFAPDVLFTSKFDAVLAVTGDREHPVYGHSATNIKNRFYMLKDTRTSKDGLEKGAWSVITDATNSSSADAPAGFYNSTNGQTIASTENGSTSTTTSNCDSGQYGYYINLENTGEKGVNAPLTVAGYTYFGTHQPKAPNANACQSNLGIARGYVVNFLNGCPLPNAPRYVQFDGGGLPPSPVTGLVIVPNPDGFSETVPFIIGGGNPAQNNGSDAKSFVGAQRINVAPARKRTRTYWYQTIDKKKG